MTGLKMNLKKYALIFIFHLFFLHSTFASMYAPDTYLSRNCLSSKTVDVCQVHTLSGYLLEIIYHGKLLRDHWGKINVYVKLNDRDAHFQMSNSNFAEHLVIGTSQRACVFCQQGRESQECFSSDRKTTDNKWSCLGPTNAEQILFYWATNDQNQLNPWKIEIAFSSGEEWDSNFGANYTFSFPADYNQQK